SCCCPASCWPSYSLTLRCWAAAATLAMATRVRMLRGDDLLGARRSGWSGTGTHVAPTLASSLPGACALQRPLSKPPSSGLQAKGSPLGAQPADQDEPPCPAVSFA